MTKGPTNQMPPRRLAMGHLVGTARQGDRCRFSLYEIKNVERL